LLLKVGAFELPKMYFFLPNMLFHPHLTLPVACDDEAGALRRRYPLTQDQRWTGQHLLRRILLRRQMPLLFVHYQGPNFRQQGSTSLTVPERGLVNPSLQRDQAVLAAGSLDCSGRQFLDPSALSVQRRIGSRDGSSWP
jgi:hypothetical protein